MRLGNTATVAAQVNYHADARFSKADSNARADWQSLSGEGDLRYGVGVAQNFHVARYHINCGWLTRKTACKLR